MNQRAHRGIRARFRDDGTAYRPGEHEIPRAMLERDAFALRDAAFLFGVVIGVFIATALLGLVTWLVR